MPDLIEVRHDSDAPGPDADPVTWLHPTGWERFATDHAVAYVLVLDGRFLLHWIESTSVGHGRAVMDAIHRWADEVHLAGRLTCELAVVGFYEKLGWHVVGGYMDGIEMWRSPR